jgi:UDP-N-acetylmuramoyl-L-alanyl-D-glutamate--2,6-diaminopimelate ligase
MFRAGTMRPRRAAPSRHHIVSFTNRTHLVRPMPVDGRARTATLADLLAATPGARLVRGDPSTPVTGVGHDTRQLQSGEVFVAIPGFRCNGLYLVPDALARGASAVVAEGIPAMARNDVPVVLVPSARAALADLAAAFYGWPSRHLQMVGVTGTDGKTTTTHLVSAILEAHDLRTGWLSTVSTKIGTRVGANASDRTTPEAPIVQRALAEMVDDAVEVGIVEASSHGLALERVRGTQFRVGIFTNLSPEHISFHGSFEAYRSAKQRLFSALPSDGLAVLNADDPHSAAMRDATQARVLTYALENDAADVRAHDIRVSPHGTRFTVDTRSGRKTASERVTVHTRLVGRFNVANWLAAFCAATYFGATLDDLCRAAAWQEPVPGRMNFLCRGQPFAVVVDFAHTPQGLEQALAAMRSVVRGRVLLAFGLPGGRDPENRAAMGRIAARDSDFFVITTDDPYDEDPAMIALQIARGATGAGVAEGDRFVIDLDRRSAIRTVLRQARPGDGVLLATHGHLDHLIIGPRKLPWNDAIEVAKELRLLGYRRAEKVVGFQDGFYPPASSLCCGGPLPR